MGILERIYIFGYLLWIVILAVNLFRDQSDAQKLKDKELRNSFGATPRVKFYNNVL